MQRALTWGLTTLPSSVQLWWSICAVYHLKQVATLDRQAHDNSSAGQLQSMNISVDSPSRAHGAQAYATISNVATPRSPCRLRRHGRFVKPSSTATLWLRAAAWPEHPNARGRQAGPALHGRLSHVSMPRRAGVAGQVVRWCAPAVSRSRKPSLTVARPLCPQVCVQGEHSNGRCSLRGRSRAAGRLRSWKEDGHLKESRHPQKTAQHS